MYQCFHCLNNSVIWSGDFTFEDMGYGWRGGLFTSAIVLIVERKSNTVFRLMPKKARRMNNV